MPGNVSAQKVAGKRFLQTVADFLQKVADFLPVTLHEN
jgi:hypothetical protein